MKNTTAKCRHTTKLDSSITLWAVAFGTVDTLKMKCSKCGKIVRNS